MFQVVYRVYFCHKVRAKLGKFLTVRAKNQSSPSKGTNIFGGFCDISCGISEAPCSFLTNQDDLE